MMPTLRLRLRLLIGIGALVAACVIASSASALVLDVVSSFPDTQGQNGLYAQAYNPTTSTFRLLDRINTRSFGTVGEPASIPRAYKSGAKVDMHATTNGTVNGKVEWAVVSWLVPTSGAYTIAGSFFNDQTGVGCTTIGKIFVNGNADNLLFAGNVNINTSAVFNLQSLSLTAGDYLRFAVDSGASYSYDLTALTASISLQESAVVPEPGSLAALACGLLGFVGIRRKR